MIFLSYRTEGDGFAAAAVRSCLVARFGEGRVFRDRESMTPGTVYPDRIMAALRSADVLVAFIGPRWLTAADVDGLRRIDDPRDWVRTELRVAFERRIPVVPVLLDDTLLPTTDDLPQDIATLALSQASRIQHGTLAEDTARLGETGAAPEPTDRSVMFNWAQPNGTIYAVQNGKLAVHPPSDHE